MHIKLGMYDIERALMNYIQEKMQSTLDWVHDDSSRRVKCGNTTASRRATEAQERQSHEDGIRSAALQGRRVGDQVFLFRRWKRN